MCGDDALRIDTLETNARSRFLFSSSSKLIYSDQRKRINDADAITKSPTVADCAVVLAVIVLAECLF